MVQTEVNSRPLPDHSIVNWFLVQNSLPELVKVQGCPAGIGSITKQRKTGSVSKREREGHVNTDLLALSEQISVQFFPLLVRGLLPVPTKGNVLDTATEAQFQKHRHCEGTPLSNHNAWFGAL